MSPSIKNKYDLDTPCILLDLEILENNLRKMQSVVGRAGKNLRPHAKTHKCSSLARRQIELGAIGVCVAKVSEAEALVNAGVQSILVTGPVATSKKIGRLVDLLTAAPSLMTVVDHRDGVDMLDAVLNARGLAMDVLLDVDVGLHRTGVKPPDAMELVDYIRTCPALRLRGIQAYAGQVQHIPAYETRRAASLESLQEAVSVFHKLRASAKESAIFSSSGTGTFDMDLVIPEVTELQVGSYACMDAEYLAIGSAEDPARFASFAPALRLLTTVVSRNQEGFVTVDAGLKSLYKDGGRPIILGPAYSGMVYEWFGDEYGMVVCPADVRMPSIGTVLELVTSHCDPTINLFDRYYLTKADEVVGEWPIDLRGCSQ